MAGGGFSGLTSQTSCPLSYGSDRISLRNPARPHNVPDFIDFGFEFAGEYGKVFLSIFRILAVIAIGWYLFKLAKQKEIPFGFILSISLIFAGAIGGTATSAGGARNGRYVATGL